MTSRTSEGKHSTRFIIEVKDDTLNKFFRTGREGISGFYSTREEAADAINIGKGFDPQGMTYRVRQK